MKYKVLFYLLICSYSSLVYSAEPSVIEINPSTNAMQQLQQRTDFSYKEWQRAVQQVATVENVVQEEERNVQRLTQQLDEAQRRQESAKQALTRSKKIEAQSRAKWEQESGGLRQEGSKPKP